MAVPGLEIVASFAASLLEGKVQELLGPDLEKKIQDFYDSARKEWKFKAVREVNP